MTQAGKAGIALAVIALGIACFAHAAAAATPKADYRFHGNRASSVPGVPDIADLGTGNTFTTETVAGCATRALTIAEGNGLQLDPSVFPSGTKTIVMDLRLNDVSDYNRLIGAASPSDDTGLYVLEGNLDWYTQTGGVDTLGSATIAPNQWVEVALFQGVAQNNFDKKLYVNGVLQNEKLDTDQLGGRLFQDNDPLPSDESSAGAVSRVSVYDSQVSPSDVTELYASGPLGNPSSCPAAAASAKGKPKVKNRGGQVLINTGVDATCPDNGVACTGTASLKSGNKAKSLTLGSATISIPAGDTHRVLFALRKRGKKLLARLGTVKATASIILTGPNGTPVSAQARGKITSP